MPSCYTKKKGTDRNGNPRFRPDDKKFLFYVVYKKEVVKRNKAF
ncbi:hypothetical protein [Bacillus cytotoxicus]